MSGMKKAMNHIMYLRVSEELWGQLKDLADEEETEVAALVRRVLKQWVKKQQMLEL